MKRLLEPCLIGNLTCANRILYAPLAGCSDWAYRKMSYKYFPGIAFCEMVKMDALVRHDPHTYRLLDYSSDMYPIGAQLCGSKPQLAGPSARILEDLGFHLIDLNCGCPVDKVTKDGSGSGLLKNLDLVGEILSNIVASVKVPVTLKIRAGWDEQSICVSELVRIAESAGAQAITIHGRTREQAYKGKSNRDYIRDGKKAAQNMLVFGNGDVFDAASAEELLAYTGCDGVLVARGTMGKPWIAEEIRLNAQGKEMNQSVSLYKDHLLEHFEWIVCYQAEKQALLDMRRVGCFYLKRLEGVKALRMQIVKASHTSEAFQAVHNFDWGRVKDSFEAGCPCSALDSQ